MQPGLVHLCPIIVSLSSPAWWCPLQSSFPSPARPSPSLFLPTYSSSVLISCAYHFNLFSCTFLDISPIFIIRLILSCLIPFHMSFSTSSCRPHQCEKFVCHWKDWRTKTWTRLVQMRYHRIIGVNISERKSGTERTKKHKKRELVFVSTARGCNWYRSASSRSYTDFARATINRDIIISGPMRPGLSRSFTNMQNTQHFTNLQSELALPSTGSWLPSRLSSTWPWADHIERIVSNSKYAKKRGII